jgi:hypothetical protein
MCTIIYVCVHYREDLGHAVAQLVEVLRYKPEGRGFNSLEFFIDITPPAAVRPWG